MPLKHNPNIPPFRVQARVEVVLDVAGLQGEDCMVAAHAAVVAREPFRAALAEDYVAGDDVFVC